MNDVQSRGHCCIVAFQNLQIQGLFTELNKQARSGPADEIRELTSKLEVDPLRGRKNIKSGSMIVKLDRLTNSQKDRFVISLKLKKMAKMHHTKNLTSKLEVDPLRRKKMRNVKLDTN